MTPCECTGMGWPEAVRGIVGVIGVTVTLCMMFWAMRHTL